ncbi:MAG: InlB B-repeat-containing protein, partial [Sulfolobaceae archaeon]
HETTRIYAKWQRVTYTITVNLNDGVVPGTSTTYTVDLNHGDTLAKLSTPVREGYTFVGWSINGYDTIYTGPIEESMNVVAVWKTSETERLQIKTEYIVYAAIIVGLLIILKQTSRKRRYR